MAGTVIERLCARLADYDGRATTVLGEAEAKLSDETGYCEALIALAAEPFGHVSDGATWLLKSALEFGRTLSGKQIDALCGRLPKVDGWAAQLHLCQSVRFLTLSRRNANDLSEWLEPLRSHPRPFLRAWSLDALAHLADQHCDHLAGFRQALAEAESDEAASVRARARNLRKRGD